MKADPIARKRAKDMRRALTRAETILWTRLKGDQLNGWRFRKQHPVGPYIADFACAPARLIVEADGATHSTPAERAHNAARTHFLEKEGWTVLRFWNSEVYENEGGVVQTILDHLQKAGAR